MDRNDFPWTATERAGLRQLYHDHDWSWPEIAETLRRTEASCRREARRDGIAPGYRIGAAGKEASA